MKKWFFLQLTEVSAWLGLIIILSAFFAPREYIAILGVVLIATDDEALKAWLAKRSPGIAKWFEELAE